MSLENIVIIGGCGHVGLPLGIAFAQAGKNVTALDINEDVVQRINGGEMPFMDKGADELLPKVIADGTFTCTTDASCIGQADVLITVIGTPVDEHLNPQFDVMSRVIMDHRDSLQPGQLLVIRSTVYPGTSNRVHNLLVEEGIDIDVAFCPERVAEGFALEEISSLPQLVGGCTERAQKRGEDLFRVLNDKIIPMKPLAAELAKLFTNSWRYIQFAVANQFYMIANDYGMDFYDIHKAMTEEYPRAKGFPRAGFAAGPCLFKDTMQLSAFHSNNFFLGHSAMLINEGLPNYLVRQAAQKYDLSTMTVAILGMTFKADSDDPRDSLSFKLKGILQIEAKAVLCSDPFLTGDGLVSVEQVLNEADLIIIGAPHTTYKDIDFGDTPVIDVWNFTEQGMTVI